MKYRRHYQVFVRNLAFFRKDTGSGDKMVDIGGSVCVLATMVFVFLRSKGNRPEQSDMLVQFAVSPSGCWTGIIPFSKLYQDVPESLATQDAGEEEAEKRLVNFSISTPQTRARGHCG
jgi:hypothetical protein